MAKGKRKFEATTNTLQDVTLIPRHARGKDLADIQPIGYLSGMDAGDVHLPCTRDIVLRLIATLKKK
jgi:hypothetical protein